MVKKRSSRRRTNGAAKKIKRPNRSAIEARERLLELAKRKGSITCHEATEALGTAQAWYHLNRLRRAGKLRHARYNAWVPTPRA
jgi:predicted ArsR family transcriptional regulator